MPSTSSEELRRLADDAFEAANWREAASLYSRAVAEGKAEVKLRGRSGAEALAAALGGRSRALAELGRRRGNLSGSPEVLEACVADARTALGLYQRLCRVGSAAEAPHPGGSAAVEQAVSWLAEALSTAGRLSEAADVLREAAAEAKDDDDGGPPRAQRLAEQLRGIELAQAAESEAPTQRAPPEAAARAADAAEAEHRATLAARLQPEIDESSDGRSPGTFRWAKTKSLFALPPLPEGLSIEVLTARGWGPYLAARGGDALLSIGKSDPSLIDSLSFPLSLAWALKRAEVLPLGSGEEGDLNVVVLGATSKAEVRLWESTSYWQEFSAALSSPSGRGGGGSTLAAPQAAFHFVGPEIDASSDAAVWPLGPPCAKTFFARRPDLLSAERTVCVVYNGGFGNFIDSKRDELLWSWLPDLLFLADSGLLCTFLCANDYADLQGECLVHTELVGSRFVVAPCRNPFSMATTFTGPSGGGSKGQSDDWFCGNSFFYVTQGCNQGQRAALDVASPRRHHALARLVQKFQSKGCLDLSDRTVRATAMTLRRAPVDKPKASGRQKKEVPADKLKSSVRQAEEVSTDTPETSVRLVEEAGRTQLRLIVEVPRLRSLAEAELQLSDTCVVLSSELGRYALRYEFPARVQSSLATAKFSSKRGRLVVEAPVSAT